MSIEKLLHCAKVVNEVNMKTETFGTHLLKHPRTSLNHLHACKKIYIFSLKHFYTQTHINTLSLLPHVFKKTLR